MRLIRLLYCSKSTNEIEPTVLESILDVSRKNNSRLNVTGLLCVDEQYFIQLLEGGCREVNDTYCRIVGDDRHEKLTLLYYENASTRMFPQWTMGYINNDRYVSNLLREYLGDPERIEANTFGKSCLDYMQTIQG